MSDGTVTTPQIIGWVVTAIGIGVGLIWNLINSVWTNRTAARLRGEQYDLNQWSRLRARVDRALDGLNNAVATIILEVQELQDEEPGNAAIDKGNHRLIGSQDELASALEECSLSGYCSGSDWLDAANGPIVNNESAWTPYWRSSKRRAPRPRRMTNLRVFRKFDRNMLK